MFTYLFHTFACWTKKYCPFYAPFAFGVLDLASWERSFWLLAAFERTSSLLHEIPIVYIFFLWMYCILEGTEIEQDQAWLALIREIWRVAESMDTNEQVYLHFSTLSRYLKAFLTSGDYLLVD